MNGPYSTRGLLKISRETKQRIEFAKKHPAMRCEACRSGGTLRKLDDKYLCVGCYDAVIAGRLKLNL